MFSLLCCRPSCVLQLEQQDRDGHPSSSTKGSRHRQWRPSLHSIAEVSS
uniref:Uncharacterized protein n=1 Tax=Aegilops tauschii subsp. strangulata TaxID=200361 RepID=A0A453R7N2_AEGTS